MKTIHTNKPSLAHSPNGVLSLTRRFTVVFPCFQTASVDSAGSRQRSREETREIQREDQVGEKVEDTPRESVGDEEEEWESEANKLYEWTQELSLDELVATPRLSVMSLTTSH